MFGALLGAVAGPLVSGILGNRSQRKAQAHADEANATKIQTAVRDAKAAGINPYYAISGGAAATGAQTIPSLASHTAIGQAFDRVADVITGRQAQESATKAVQEDLAEIAHDTARRGSIAPTGAGSGVATGTAGPSAPSLISPAATAYPSVFNPDGSPMIDERLGVLSNHGAITETGRRGGEMFPHPLARDMGAVEERHGETPELYSMISWPYSQMRDAQYSHRLGQWAREQDINPRDAHEQLMDDPSRIDELPSFGQSLWAEMARETSREWQQIREYLPTTEPATETFHYPRLGGMMGSSF
jgi:hypothetical protein